jgi:hypothetical protein
MDINQEEHNRRVQAFLATDFDWQFSAGECNFLLQLMAYVVESNPAFVLNPKGDREPLNYQSIRSIVLLNEKLSAQLQRYAEEASVIIGQMPSASDKVQ